jgi:hypothetical protein
MESSLSDPWAYLSEGAQLTLSVNTAHDIISDVQAKITYAFQPFTMSPVIRVSLLDSSLVGASEAILKLYDYRCMTNDREQFDESLPWSQTKELAYQQYLADSPRPVEEFDNPGFMLDKEISDGEFEAYLKRSCEMNLKAEMETYERLKEGQGAWLPRFYNLVSVKRGDGTIVDGLLFEYIPSITLRDFVKTWTTRTPPLPIDLLKRICDTGVEIVNRVSDFDILNKDVRLDNFLIRESALVKTEGTEPEPHPVVLIDLASCRSRQSEETDDAWKTAKLLWDETGALGFVLERKMEDQVGKGIWKFEWKSRYFEDINED